LFATVLNSFSFRVWLFVPTKSLSFTKPSSLLA
jgi:hypothetical protein